jgi:hypothetical protein
MTKQNLTTEPSNSTKPVLCTVIKIRSKILEIQYLSMICETIGFHCFTEFLPHCNLFKIQLYDGEWKVGREAIETEFYIDNKQKSIDKANNVIYQLKTIIKKQKINYEELMQVENVSYAYRF